MSLCRFLWGTLAIVGIAFANSDAHDFGNIPYDHILFGPGGETSLQDTTSHPSARQVSNSCANGPQTRSCWSDGFNVGTDFDKKWPTTGNTRRYDWTITNTTCNLDGKSPGRVCMLVNGQYPGPTLEADWGDMISVTVHNNLQDNGTSIHWHGIRQFNTNAMDGTNGLTECPLAPGQSETYIFQATQFGTSWYHSHYTSQYADGVVGPIVINGPASANYDIDLGPMPVTDWYYQTATQVNILNNIEAQSELPGPPPDAILINGTNGQNSGDDLVVNLTPGKLYRMRLINTAAEAQIRVSIDNHQMQVISSDFVPTHPEFADSVVIAGGQRYDVIINASQPVGNYWMRAFPDEVCQSRSNTNATAIIRYDGAPNVAPTTTPTFILNGCNPPGDLVPVFPNDVGDIDQFQSQVRNLTVGLNVPGTTTNNQNIVTWAINFTAIDVQWETPTLEYVRSGNTSYPTTANLIELPNEGTWVYWIIQGIGDVPVWHPMHLHGHDFYILGNGTGIFDPQVDAQNLDYQNATRRDTTNLPAGGWVILAFPTDNPGAWLFHCHIAWHVAEGLGVQFLEAKQSINIPETFQSQCSAWDAYYDNALYKQDDSGL